MTKTKSESGISVMHLALRRRVSIKDHMDASFSKFLNKFRSKNEGCIFHVEVRDEREAAIMSSLILSRYFQATYPPGYRMVRRCDSPKCINPYHRQSMIDQLEDYESSPESNRIKSFLNENGELKPLDLSGQL